MYKNILWCFSLCFVLVLSLFFTTTDVLARIGVGVGTGKIIIEDPLRAGMIHDLPVLTVINTGDIKSKYKVSLAYHEGQPELKPQEAWLHFSPNDFYLEPSKTQMVNMRMELPLQTEPGKYFAYIEAQPVPEEVATTSSVSVAAGVKFHFEVAPANIFQAMYYRSLSIWNHYQPWSFRFVLAVLFLIGAVIIKRNFNIELKRKS